MVDIKDSTILSTSFSERIDSVDGTSFMNDEMENLAYSDSESASIAMPDEEFRDALDQLEAIDVNRISKENGEF